MRVARDIAGFTLPFAVGVLLTVYAGTHFCPSSSALHIIVLFGIFLAVTALITRREFGFRTIEIQLLIAVSACLCGVLSGLTGLSLGTNLPISSIEAAAVGSCGKMQDVIDSIPFKSDGTGALIKALLTGERSSLPREMTEAFRDSGASHILALSGLHLGIIYGILHKSLSIIGNSIPVRRLRSVLIITACGFYTITTGAGPSIVRAFLFILLGETAGLTGRGRTLSHILLSALLIQLTLSPLSARSIGFQLSYAAMAGIAFIYPWLKGFWPADEALSPVGRLFGKGMRRIWDSLALSISCQITTGPLAYMYFGTFPMHFLLTNLLALPLTGILIPAALLTMVLCGLGCCPAMLVSATEFLAQALIQSLHVIATM